MWDNQPTSSTAVSHQRAGGLLVRCSKPSDFAPKQCTCCCFLSCLILHCFLSGLARMGPDAQTLCWMITTFPHRYFESASIFKEDSLPNTRADAGHYAKGQSLSRQWEKCSFHIRLGTEIWVWRELWERQISVSKILPLWLSFQTCSDNAASVANHLKSGSISDHKDRNLLWSHTELHQLRFWFNGEFV